MSTLSTPLTHIPPYGFCWFYPHAFGSRALLFVCSLYPSALFVPLCHSFRMQAVQALFVATTVCQYVLFVFAYIFLVFYIFEMSSDYAGAVTFIIAGCLARYLKYLYLCTTHIAYHILRWMPSQAVASFTGAVIVCTRPVFAFIIFSLQISFDAKYVLRALKYVFMYM